MWTVLLIPLYAVKADDRSFASSAVLNVGYTVRKETEQLLLRTPLDGLRFDLPVICGFVISGERVSGSRKYDKLTNSLHQ